MKGKIPSIYIVDVNTTHSLSSFKFVSLFLHLTLVFSSQRHLLSVRTHPPIHQKSGIVQGFFRGKMASSATSLSLKGSAICESIHQWVL
uniref:Uncharacterized protein n=1 Tax=Arundo donax TaxID=35708 RepID=A0A0A9NFS3_ARUDO